jgi:hypothetical protein
MTGPEHYAEAERLLRPDGESYSAPARQAKLAEAQIHATLALAAATALGATQIHHAGRFFTAMPWRDSKAWQDALGVES